MSPLVSIVVTTRNEELVIGRLLSSIRNQTYEKTEVILVDNGSTDRTKSIARAYTDFVFDAGPERSAQRNLGVQHARGAYALILDADMELQPDVVAACVAALEGDSMIKAVVIPEESFGSGFWSRCKALERSCYVGDDSVEAARFFDRGVFLEFGGYDTALTGPEDWDLPQRIRQKYAVGRAQSVIRHNEGRLSLPVVMRKKYYYGKSFGRYAAKHRTAALHQANLVFRPAFFRSSRRLMRQPDLLLGIVVMKTLEMAAGFAGFAFGTFQSTYQAIPKRVRPT